VAATFLGMSGQLSFFSASSEPATPGDLAGLLCGPGQLVRRGDSARVSVVVADLWRSEALLTEYAERSLDGEAVTAAPDDTRSVRTRFDAALDPLARQWAGSGAGKRVPPGFLLSGAALRLWCIAAVHQWEDGYALGLGERDEACWEPIGVALAHAGLPAVLVGPRGGGPAFRITRRRRVRRLGELVGDPPAGVPSGGWPV
jgi:hypothetical protein